MPADAADIHGLEASALIRETRGKRIGVHSWFTDLVGICAAFAFISVTE